jgi:hypothetical protein
MYAFTELSPFTMILMPLPTPKVSSALLQNGRIGEKFPNPAGPKLVQPPRHGGFELPALGRSAAKRHALGTMLR